MINLKNHSQHTCSTRPTPIAPQTASLVVANPFGQTALAYCNGSFISTPLRPIPITKRRPRTQFIHAFQYEMLTQGY